MLRFLVATLALATCVAASNAYGPKNFGEYFTGSWKTEPVVDQNTQAFWLNGTTTGFITQRVDNFNVQNDATFEQRYYSNGGYFRAGGPIYLIFGSQRPASSYELDYTLIGSVARSEFGHVFLLENRFFGRSVPTANLSVDNLQFLTVEQALADAAHFINYIKSVTPGAQDSRVIVLGRQYGGSMAVWFRQKYPHLTAGAWASSAPLEALQNHQQYKEFAGEAIRDLAGDECYNAIDAGFRSLEALANAGELAELGQLLNVCDESPLENDNDVSLLFLLISEFFTIISNFRPVVPFVCELILDNSTATPAEAIASVFEYFDSDGCLTVEYERFVSEDSQIELDSEFAYWGIRQLTYQRCTQLGWFTTSDSPNQPFGSLYPLAFFTEFCTRVFGQEVANHAIAHANQDRFNVEHGGLNPWISNALFTYGDQDPTRSIIVTRDLHESAVALPIRGAAIAYDFNGISTFDNQVLIDAKLDIMAVIRSWNN